MTKNKVVAAVVITLLLSVSVTNVNYTLNNFQLFSQQLVNRVAYMIPYTISNWLFPPIVNTPANMWLHERRLSHAKQYRQQFIDLKLNVFSTPEYAAFSQTKKNYDAMQKTEECFSNIQINKVADMDQEELIEVSARLHALWSNKEGSVIFIDSNGKPSGWAIRHISASSALISFIKGKNKEPLITGYFYQKQAVGSVNKQRSSEMYVVLVSKNFEIMCSSSLLKT